MRYNIRHTTMYSYTDPVPVCHNLVHLAPRDTPAQSCREHRVAIDPQPSVRAKRRDYFGNDVEFFSIQEAHEGLSVTAMSLVDVASPVLKVGVKTPAWEEVVGGDPDELAAARTGRVFPDACPRRGFVPRRRSPNTRDPASRERRPIFDAVRDFTSRIHSDFTFDAKATTVSTPPEELLDAAARRVPGLSPICRSPACGRWASRRGT